jgi:hypothetical protein
MCAAIKHHFIASFATPAEERYQRDDSSHPVPVSAHNEDFNSLVAISTFRSSPTPPRL